VFKAEEFRELSVPLPAIIQVKTIKLSEYDIEKIGKIKPEKI
jgi:hypothetical protein